MKGWGRRAWRERGREVDWQADTQAESVNATIVMLFFQEH